MSNEPEKQCTGMGAGDETTGAIYDVIHTMGSEETGSAQDSTAASGGTSGETGSSSDGKPLGRANVDAETWLIEQGYIGRRSMGLRRVLGCVGCRFAGQGSDSETITAREIAECSGMDSGNAHRALTRLAGAGLIVSQPQKEAAGVGRRPDLFSLTDEGAHSDFTRHLEAPGECGLRRAEGQLRPNAGVEELLVEAGIITNRANASRAILGCMACKSQTGEGVYMSGIEKCQGIEHSWAHTMLKRLEEAGIVRAEEQQSTGRGRPRIIYTFTETDLAGSLIEAAEIPQQCGLEEE